MTTARAFERATTTAIIGAVIPTLEAELLKMEEQRLNAAFGELRANTLLPEQAMAILQEVFTYRELARKLRLRLALTEGGT